MALKGLPLTFRYSEALGYQKPDRGVEGHTTMTATHLHALAVGVAALLQGGLPVDDTIALGIDRGGRHRRRVVQQILIYG